MKFKYDPDTSRLVSEEDPSIFVEYHGLKRETGGITYILYWGDLRIGFSNAIPSGETQGNKIEEDGTSVFSLNQIGCQVRGSNRPWPTLTNFKKFDSVAQQTEAINLICDALRIYDGYHSHMVAGTAKGRVEVTDDLKERIDSGEFVR
ncbi:MAG: hypothetical protein ABJ388_06140 [Alphaproteobacteria bacterium]|uniref:hypothetical protein n=1 Tax=Nisaea sp. TaxID=2024842 RepID=UPI003264D77E